MLVGVSVVIVVEGVGGRIVAFVSAEKLVW
jgi:hypothetical protein